MTAKSILIAAVALIQSLTLSVSALETDEEMIPTGGVGFSIEIGPRPYYYGPYDPYGPCFGPGGAYYGPGCPMYYYHYGPGYRYYHHDRWDRHGGRHGGRHHGGRRH